MGSEMCIRDRSKTTLKEVVVDARSLTAVDSFDNAVNCSLQGPVRNAQPLAGLLQSDATVGLFTFLSRNSRNIYSCIKDIDQVSTVDTVVIEASGAGLINDEPVQWVIDERDRVRFAGTDLTVDWFDVIPTGETGSFTARQDQAILSCNSVATEG